MKSYLTRVFGADLRSLAALRIGCAALIILDLLQRSTDLVAHYTDYGVVPRTLVMQHSSSRWYVSLHFMSGVWQMQALLFVLAALAAAALLVGYRTRLASILSWALFVSLCTRNPYVLQGGDMLLRVVLFWGMFLPWGAVYSVDRAWQDDSSAETPKRYVSLGTAAYAIQIVSMYWFTVLLKSGSQWWSEGSAVYYALSIDQLVTPIGKLLAELPQGALAFVTWKVAAFEIVGPFLLLMPLKKGKVRLYTTLCFIALQSAFLLSFFIGIFPVIGIISMFFFLPGMFWDRFEQRLGIKQSATVKIYYDEDCGFCVRTVRLIQTFFLPAAEVSAAQTITEIETDMRQHNSLVVLDAQGTRHYGYDGIVMVAATSPISKLFVPVLRVRAIRRCGERLYSYVATHRQTRCGLPDRSRIYPESRTLGKPLKVVLCAIIGYVFILNLSTIPPLGLRIPETVKSASNIFGLDQTWNMFAPFPAKDDGWYVIPGTLRNGKAVDLFRQGKDVTFNKATYPSLEYKNHRWRKYMELLRKRPALQPVYARYVCREWNRQHSGDQILEELEIVFVLEWTQPRSEYSPIEKHSIGKFRCGI
jgi:predicted DCC family thiol-disulfide oxidoreductase YuxK